MALKYRDSAPLKHRWVLAVSFHYGVQTYAEKTPGRIEKSEHGIYKFCKSECRLGSEISF